MSRAMVTVPLRPSLVHTNAAQERASNQGFMLLAAGLQIHTGESAVDRERQRRHVNLRQVNVRQAPPGHTGDRLAIDVRQTQAGSEEVVDAAMAGACIDKRRNGLDTSD